ncbi:MAG: hypothetical protein GY811_20910 [Myxococcales bacterium]|nr:hypothetical protein [Myxococcales bacterium]
MKWVTSPRKDTNEPHGRPSSSFDGDIMKAFGEFKVPQNETEEVMCIILSMKDDLIVAK